MKRHTSAFLLHHTTLADFTLNGKSPNSESPRLSKNGKTFDPMRNDGKIMKKNEKKI
jgi:hypothetical protein